MISAIILAAGTSSRMGSQKLLLEIGKTTVIEKVLSTVCETDALDEMLLVYNQQAVKAIAEGYSVKTVCNPAPQLGLSSSIKLGIREACPNTDAYMFFMGDQPFIERTVIEKLVNEYKIGKKSIIVPVYEGNNGMPTIFAAKWKSDFMLIEGDTGGRTIIKKNLDAVQFVNIQNQFAGMDIDTKEAYEKALQIANKQVKTP